MTNVYCSRRSLDGCGGRLCRSCSRLLRRFAVERYQTDSDGNEDTAAEPQTGSVCGFTSRERNRDGSIVIAGRGGARLRLTVAADSLGGIKCADRITVDGVICRVVSVEGTSPVIAALVPEE